MENSKHTLLHFPGHHGNFLSRMFDIACEKVINFDVFNNVTGTAHANKKLYPHQTFKTVCPGELLGEWENAYALSGKDVSITYTQDHAFETVYLLFKANRDRNINLLDDAQLERAFAMTPDVFENRNILVDPRMFDNHYDWLKYQFHVVRELARTHLKLDYQFNIDCIYGSTSEFITELKNLLDYYEQSYIIDIRPQHSKFLKLRESMIAAKEKSGSLFQEAYLDYLKEKPAQIDPLIVGPRYKAYIKNY